LKLSPEQDRQIRELGAERKHTLRQIAVMVGVSRDAVRARVEPLEKVADPRRDEAKALRASGNTVRAIAAHFSVSPSIIVRWTNRPRKKTVALSESGKAHDAKGTHPVTGEPR
jgi:hypothetical protein